MHDDASGYSAAKNLLRQGLLVQAERALRGVLNANPRHVAARYDLGMTLVQQKRVPEAVGAFEQALAIDPNLTSALEVLGKLYGDTGQNVEALRCLDRLLALMPISPNVHFHHSLRGWALLRLARLNEAATAFETAVARRPDFVGAWEILGVVYGELGRPIDALHCFDRLTALLPRYAPGHDYRGMTLARLRRYEEAIACFHEALRLDPKFLRSRFNMADPLSALDRNDEALEAYEDVLKADPKNASVELGRGDILQILGRIDEAAAAYERAISLAPHTPTAYRHLLQVRAVASEGDPVLKGLVAMQAEEAKLTPVDSVELHLALSKAYRDLGRYGPAFEHLREGNRRKRSTFTYDEAGALAFLRAPASVLTPQVMQAMAGVGDPSERPVFVLGMARSGTSLVEQILASHSGVFGAGETPDFQRLLEPRFGLQLEKIGNGLSGEALRQFGADYDAHLAAKAPGALRVIDKTLGNFCYAGLIHLALPKARIIHVVRDPMDTCFSCYSQLFMGVAPFACDLGELGRYYKVYAEVMAYWRRVLPPESMLEIRYEALVENFDTEARRLVAFCGLDWEDACSRFYDTKRAVRTASAVQVRQPLYKEAVGRWILYAEWLGPLREALEL